MFYQSTVKALEFLIERETLDNKHSKATFSSYYEKIRNSLINSDSSSFFAAVLTASLYTHLKNKKFKAEELMGCKSLALFFAKYASFSNYFEDTFEKEINEASERLNCFLNFDNIENKSETVSYILSESVLEYSLSKNRIIPKFNKVKEFSNKISQSFLQAKNDKDILTALYDKPFGYYIFSVPYSKNLGDTTSLPDFAIVGHQGEYTSICNLYSSYNGRFGFNRANLSILNVFNQRYNFVPVFKQTSNSISENLNHQKTDFDNLDLTNQLIIKTLISLISVETHLTENKDSAFLILKNKVDLTPLKIDSEFNEFNDLDLNDLKFSEKYNFLSHLDDLFIDYLNVEKLKISSNNDDGYHHLDIIRNVNKPTIPTLEYFDSCFKLKSYSFKNWPISLDSSLNFINSIDPVFIGTETEVYNYSKKIMTMNKLTYYNTYINLYHEFYSAKFVDAIGAFINENIDEIIEDPDFLSLIKTVGLIRNTNINHENLLNFYNISLITKEKSAIVDAGRASFTELKDYTSKTKSSHLMSLYLDDYKIFEFLQNKYGLSLDDKLNNIVYFLKIKILLNDMYKSIELKNKTRVNFHCFIDNDIDLELNQWMTGVSGVFALIPLNKKQVLNITKRFNDINSSDIIQDCNNNTGKSFVY